MSFHFAAVEFRSPGLLPCRISNKSVKVLLLFVTALSAPPSLLSVLEIAVGREGQMRV